jgi:hypothetical protein
MNILNKFIKQILGLMLFIALPVMAIAQTANLQVIHNAADPSAQMVDVYLNGALALDDFSFRDATPFLELPANVEHTIVIAPPTSNSVADGIATFNVTLDAGVNYIAVANGVLTPANFADNPDGKATGFNLNIIANVNTASANSSNVSVNVFHGATDAPAVDIAARAATPVVLVPGAEYLDSGSLEVPAADYTLEIYVAGTSILAGAFDAPLAGAGGAAITVLASGFLNVDANEFGPQFGLLAVFADGTTLMLPSKTGKVQVIHNAADPGATMVDVYLNGALAIEGFEFRAATPYIELPAHLNHYISIAPPNSNSVDDALATFSASLAEDQAYQIVANGVLSPGDFAANPSGESTAFTLFVLPAAREAAVNVAEVDFRVLHGASDAPAVDIRLSGGGAVLVPNAAYGDVSNYISVPGGAYSVDVTLPGDPNAVVETYDVDVTGLVGGAALLLASGFLSPADNNNGPAFGVLIVLPDGTAFLAPTSTSIDDERGMAPSKFELKGNYPNPFNPSTVIRYNVPNTADVSLSVYDMLGRQVAVLVNGLQSAGSYDVTFNATNLSSGVYLYRLQSGDFVQTQKMMLVK